MRKAQLLLMGMLACMSAMAGPIDSVPRGTTMNDSFPHAEISNGLVRAAFYMPDTATGYYRGSRFDWSGVMPKLEYKGHSYSGEWYDKYAPTINDAIMGPVEAFAPIGYDQAVPGGSFVVIGIGAMIRPAVPYTPFRYYPVVNPGTWVMHSDADSIEFTQNLDDSTCSYSYNKKLVLARGKPELEIRHALRNRGDHPIITEVYDHNLFMLDRQTVGPDLVLRFPFNLTATEQRGIGTLASVVGSQITFLQKLEKRQSTYAVLQGYGNQAKDYDIRIENHHTGAAVHITADRPLSRLVFWSCPTTACPEPYIRVRVDPGEIFFWTLRYEFYECSTDQK